MLRLPLRRMIHQLQTLYTNNHFASVILRSDDFKYAVSGEVSRVGFYLDPQLPWLGIDIDAKYFSGAAKTAYKWDSNTSGISSSTGQDAEVYDYV